MSGNLSIAVGMVDPLLLNCLAVGVGGFVGSVARYLIGAAVPAADFPWATMLINVVGSFALAFIASWIAGGGGMDDRLSLMLRVGLCGGFTTFSTFSVEAMGLIQDGQIPSAIAYCVGTVVLCILASFGGSWMARL